MTPTRIIGIVIIYFLKGAFEAAANEFSTVICPRLWSICAKECQNEIVNTSFPYSPREWIDQILAALTGKNGISKSIKIEYS